ncbi:MAG: hypothetical protein K0M45_04555 [Candidatus Paracaedibacteraceae bacterium]|nr:hypothetical protein [Candidatus Paracaedibacteraceae bacterium]
MWYIWIMEKDLNTSPHLEEYILWKRTKIVLRFWKRHFFTLLLSTPFLMCLVTLNENAISWGFFLIVAMCVDAGKSQKGNIRSTSSEDYRTLQQQQPWNDSLVGTPAYISRIGER